jgi:hypothetical protein
MVDNWFNVQYGFKSKMEKSTFLEIWNKYKSNFINGILDLIIPDILKW